jgi:uncharacterized protein (DUF1697 family)
MRNAKLCAVFEELGFTDVRPVLASGNIVFASTARSSAALEKKIEQALEKKLALKLDVMVRPRAELEAMLKGDPFDGATHSREQYLIVTFRKDDPAPVFGKIVREETDGAEFMVELEKRYGKRITTRTWNTIGKIVAKMKETA